MKKIAKKLAKKFGIKKKKSIKLMKQIKSNNSMSIGNSYAETFGVNRWKVREFVQKMKR